MGFQTRLQIGEETSHAKLIEIFKCGNMGGMRKSNKTGTLVIVSDNTKGLYQDQWRDRVLHYTGMGKLGNQVLKGNQNSTLYYSDTNGIEVHLFEVLEKTVYTYKGVVRLAGKPYEANQPDDDGNMRTVWMFPLVPENSKSISEFNIPEIRLIPMSPEEFKGYSIEDIQQKFFLSDLINREGCGYYYKERGLNSENNALLLFQIRGEIIAAARLDCVVEDEGYEGYRGAYYLYPDSIIVFEPITLYDLKSVCPEFKAFTQSKQFIDIKHLNDILELICEKSKNYKLADEGMEVTTEVAENEAKQLDNDELLKRIKNNKIPKKVKKTELVNYYRDPYLKFLVKRLAKGKCQLCRENAPFEDKHGEPYLEVHHVKRLADGGKDEIKNIVAICPNCHRRIHILDDEKYKTILEGIAEKNSEKVLYRLEE